MNTTIEAVLYTSKTLSNGQHPIMLRLTKNRKRKYISLHISLTPQYWDAEKCKPRRNCPDKERIEALIQQKTQELQSQVMDFKTNDKEYTLNTLVEKASHKVVRQTVEEYLNDYINRLLAEKRIGNAKTFQELRTSLTKFCCSLDFYFIDIDTEWLKRYEQWLRVERHYSENSIGIRFRSLRVLYNSAIADGLIRKADYPFDTFKVSKFKETTAKRSLTKEDIRRIMDCEVQMLTKYPKPFLQLAKDLFLFSYLSCGINLTDILHIRHADIVDGRLVINRQKTGKLLSFQLQPAALDIIDKYRRRNAHPQDYIFPVLRRSVHITAQQQYARVQRTNKRVNRYLKLIGEHLHLPIALTTYVARHSFATVLKRSGVSTAIISESLGHSSEKITQIYLDSFENSQIDAAMAHLL
ncbi:site-specific integrase [uncultured Alistipes sp.]|uniref:site-specific integrase n=1 Tax=uncultured Alistipes sp. TaxID=538949 RepID=UPI00266F2757|nr:site-specific integrase [uncultured Alistipes sp.]